MEIKILEDKKGRLVFELHGADHTIANALKDELWNEKGVAVAAYTIEHPLKPVPKFILESADPKKSLADASKRLQKRNDDIKKVVAKL